MTSSRRTARFRLGVAMLATIAAAVVLVPAPSSADPNLGQLNSQLGHEQSRQHDQRSHLSEHADRLCCEKDRAAASGPASNVLDQMVGRERRLRRRRAAARA